MDDNITMEVSIPLPEDENGLVARQCPNESCRLLFKIKPGTGLLGEDVVDAHCPYCGARAEQEDFTTEQQLELLYATGRQKLQEEVFRQLHQDFHGKKQTTKTGLIDFSMEWKVTPGDPSPIPAYIHEDLETHVTCKDCALEYAVYGLFAYCPDCAKHNSVQILERNLKLAARKLELAEGADDVALSESLVHSALGDAVAAFDGFGKELVSVHGIAGRLSFQNLVAANDTLTQKAGVSLSSLVTEGEWLRLIRSFQKRHVIAHRMGVVDEEYAKKVDDPEAVIGRKVVVTGEEVTATLDALLKLGPALSAALQQPVSQAPIRPRS